MKTDLFRVDLAGLVGCVLAFPCGNAFALGSDYPTNQPAQNRGLWPAGMEDLVNITNRVHGFFVNDEDVFFFSGTATDFSAFLQKFSKIGGPVSFHPLVLHEGIGQAKSPWDKAGRACDWELDGRGNGWKAGVITNYVLEVHFWTGGRIALDKVAIPANVEVEKAK